MLIQQIDSDLVNAMKEKNETDVSTLRMLKSAIKNTEIQKKKELTDEDIVSVIQSQIKSRKDSIEMYKKGNRLELAEKEQSEIDILKEYLPEQMSDDAVREVVKKAISDIGANGMQDMGKVMGKAMGELKGKADGSKISQIVKDELSK